MPTYKLTYFPFLGLAEHIRFILCYADAKYEDILIEPLKSWPFVKPTMPYGQLPVLEIDGKTYHQTLPICRYLAKRYNIGGKTDLDALEIDAIVNSINDFRLVLTVYYWVTDPVEKATKKESIEKQTLPYYMKRFDDLVKHNGGYFHGGELSYADLFFAAAYDYFNTVLGYDVLRDYPNLRKLTDKVVALPRIASYLPRRPASNLPEVGLYK